MMWEAFNRLSSHFPTVFGSDCFGSLLKVGVVPKLDITRVVMHIRSAFALL